MIEKLNLRNIKVYLICNIGKINTYDTSSKKMLSYKNDVVNAAFIKKQ